MNLATATDLAFKEEVHSTIENDSFGADIANLSNLIADCMRSTDCFLSDPINRGKAGRFRINHITVGLLVLNVTLTLVLNISMLSAGANTVQLLISNAGLMILHLLASICIASDLARGKTHFLNERAHLARQFHELSEQITDLLRERQKWVDALNRCKWSMDAEQLKIQLAAQEVKSLEEKVLSGQAKLTEEQSKLDTLTSQQASAKLELQKSIKEREATHAESNKLQSENAKLKGQQTELASKTQELEVLKQSKLGDIHRIEEEIQSLASKRSGKENELSTLQIELDDAIASLTAQQSKQTDSVTAFESKIAQLSLDQSNREATIQASKLSLNELQATNEELQLQIEVARTERELALTQLQQEIAIAEAALVTKQTAIESSQTALNALSERRNEVNKELTQIQGILDELNSKTGYAQACNVQLVNESISLELKCNQHRESLAGMEAEHARVQHQIDDANAELDSLRTEENAIKSRISDLTKVEESQVVLGEIEETKTQLELELANTKNELQEILSQREVAQQSNLQLTSESKNLELRVIQHRELVSQFEAELTAIQLQLTDKNSSLDSLQAEELKLENRVANLLTQASKFDCLAVATNETLSYAQEQELSEQLKIVTDLQEQKASLDKALLETQSKMDAEKAAAKQICEDATHMQADAEKSIADAERRVEMLSEKAETLVAQVQNRSAELFAIKQEMIELRAEVRDLEATNLELKEVEQELAGLKSQLTEHRAQMASIAVQIADGEATYDTQLQASEAIATQIASLESQLQCVCEQFAARTQTLEQLTEDQDAIVAQNRQLTEQKDALEFAIYQSRQTLDETTKRIDELRDAAQCQREQISQLEAERSALESDLMNLTSTVQVLHAERNQLEEETEQLRELAGQRSAMQEEIENFSASIDSLTQQQAAAIELLSSNEQSIRETELQLNTLRNQLTELEQQRTESTAAQIQAAQELADTVQLQQSAIEQYDAVAQQTEASQKRLREVQSQLDSLTAQQNSASSSLQTVIDEVNDAQAVAKQWATYIDSLKLDVESQRRTQSELQLSIESLRKGESDAMMDMERATRVVESLFEQQTSLRAANQSEDLTLRVAQRALEEATAQRDALRHELIDQQRLLAKTTSQLEDTNAELRTVEASVSAAIATQSSLENRILEGQVTLEHIASDHENHLSRIRNLVEEQEFLETSICGLNKQVALSESLIASLDSRKYELEMELSQQQASHEIASEKQAALESEIATLNTETATLQLKKHELAILEADCNTRTEILNALCEESVLEQSRLVELKEQISLSQQILADMQEQRAHASAVHAQLESETDSMKQTLQLANDELQDRVEARDTAEKLIEDFNQELKRFTEEKASVENEIQRLSEYLNAKLIALRATQEEASVAETKALELWATVSELQALGTELDKSLSSKHESIGQANVEMIKVDELRETTLAQQQSLERTVAELTALLHESQNSKIILDREIATLNLDFDRVQTKIANANSELELLSKKRFETSASAQSESTDMPEPVEALSATPVSSSENMEVTLSEPTNLQESDATFLSQEEDIWTSLGEIARLGDVIGINTDGAEMDSTRSNSSKPLEAVSILASPEVDAWETVFSRSNTQPRI